MYFSDKTKNYLEHFSEKPIMKTYMDNLRDEVRDEYNTKIAKKLLNNGYSEELIIDILELS
jgi:hypothetical protein